MDDFGNPYSVPIRPDSPGSDSERSRSPSPGRRSGSVTPLGSLVEDEDEDLEGASTDTESSTTPTDPSTTSSDESLSQRYYPCREIDLLQWNMPGYDALLTPTLSPAHPPNVPEEDNIEMDDDSDDTDAETLNLEVDDNDDNDNDNDNNENHNNDNNESEEPGPSRRRSRRRKRRRVPQRRPEQLQKRPPPRRRLPPGMHLPPRGRCGNSFRPPLSTYDRCPTPYSVRTPETNSDREELDCVPEDNEEDENGEDDSCTRRFEFIGPDFTIGLQTDLLYSDYAANDPVVLILLLATTLCYILDHFDVLSNDNNLENDPGSRDPRAPVLFHVNVPNDTSGNFLYDIIIDYDDDDDENNDIDDGIDNEINNDIVNDIENDIVNDIDNDIFNDNDIVNDNDIENDNDIINDIDNDIENDNDLDDDNDDTEESLSEMDTKKNPDVRVVTPPPWRTFADLVNDPDVQIVYAPVFRDKNDSDDDTDDSLSDMDMEMDRDARFLRPPRWRTLDELENDPNAHIVYPPVFNYANEWNDDTDDSSSEIDIEMDRDARMVRPPRWRNNNELVNNPDVMIAHPPPVLNDENELNDDTDDSSSEMDIEMERDDRVDRPPRWRTLEELENDPDVQIAYPPDVKYKKALDNYSNDNEPDIDPGAMIVKPADNLNDDDLECTFDGLIIKSPDFLNDNEMGNDPNAMSGPLPYLSDNELEDDDIYVCPLGILPYYGLEEEPNVMIIRPPAYLTGYHQLDNDPDTRFVNTPDVPSDDESNDGPDVVFVRTPHFVNSHLYEDDPDILVVTTSQAWNYALLESDPDVMIVRPSQAWNYTVLPDNPDVTMVTRPDFRDNPLDNDQDVMILVSEGIRDNTHLTGCRYCIFTDVDGNIHLYCRCAFEDVTEREYQENLNRKMDGLCDDVDDDDVPLPEPQSPSASRPETPPHPEQPKPVYPPLPPPEPLPRDPPSPPLIPTGPIPPPSQARIGTVWIESGRLASGTLEAFVYMRVMHNLI